MSHNLSMQELFDNELPCDYCFLFVLQNVGMKKAACNKVAMDLCTYMRWFFWGEGLFTQVLVVFFGAQLTLTTVEVRFSKFGHNSGATFLTQLKRSSYVGFWISTEEVCFCFSFAASLHVSPLTFGPQLTINCEQWSIDEQKQRWGIWSLLPSSTFENLSKTTGPFQTRAENRPRYWALTNSSEIYYLYEILS